MVILQFPEPPDGRRRRNPEVALGLLNRRFRRVSRRSERRARSLRVVRGALKPTVIVLGLALVFAVGLSFSPWPPLLTLRHIAAAPNCAAARAVGLAPAYRGEPGYYPSHDRDDDGVACEPWPVRSRH